MRRSKHGKLFCSRACKEEAQSDVSFGISPPHYGTGNLQNSYRRLALQHNAPRCTICGYDAHENVLEVHHKDKDRSNNELENLVVLCPTCHKELHRGHQRL